MRWREGRRSTNVEDRRGQSGPRIPTGGKLGGGALILALLAFLFLGEDAGQLIDLVGGGGPAVQAPAPSQPAAPGNAANDEIGQFVRVVLGSTEDTWNAIFAQYNERYPAPQLVLYDRAVQSACGFNTAATGPFYCPGDRKVYLDTSFLAQLKRLGAPGDFAFAYVIAHEVGHHIQAVTGTEQDVRRMQQRLGQRDRNQLSVRMELQADCYAGVWAHHVNQRNDGVSDQIQLEAGDIEEGMRAAAAVGDDRLQEMAGQRVQPEAFTHGSSEQRMQWFRRGLQTGDIQSCDTFGN